MTPLGRLVQQRMDEQGLTIGSAARICNMNWGPMRNIVEGKVSSPWPETIARLQRGLGITDDDLRAIGYPIPDGEPVPASELPPALAAKAARSEALHDYGGRAAAEPPAPIAGQQALALGLGAEGTAGVDLQAWRDWGAEAVLVATIERVRSGLAGPSQEWGPELAKRLGRMVDLGEQAEALVRF